jgi:hypothetical protein
MTASGIGLEGHGGDLWSEAEQAFTLSSPGYQLAYPCNNAIHVCGAIKGSANWALKL